MIKKKNKTFRKTVDLLAIPSNRGPTNFYFTLWGFCNSAASCRLSGYHLICCLCFYLLTFCFKMQAYILNVPLLFFGDTANKMDVPTEMKVGN